MATPIHWEPRLLKTILIANRGEIAVRICKTARRCGIKTIVVYTAADVPSLHLEGADLAVRLHGSDSDAYLDGEQLIRIAKKHEALAIIPGYGFLSENADFARQVVRAGLVFVGPKPDVIETFGTKHKAKELAVSAGVPVIPGSKGLVDTEDEAVHAADQLEYPVMLKAAAGGGGLGLATCHNAAEVLSSFKTVQSRATALFKDNGVFVEKHLSKAHHIEVQVFGNGMGQAIHLGERECSIQRRHQKIIEECPSPFIGEDTQMREKLCSAAVRLAESVNYSSAGTVEFLVDDESSEIFFLEMNPRLQVEHGITEMIHGVDIVELMLKQADVELLTSGAARDRGLEAGDLANIQASILNPPKRYAIEARVYAENPVRGHAPSPGVLQEVLWNDTGRPIPKDLLDRDTPDFDLDLDHDTSEPPEVRIDTWISRGVQITTNYDALLAKIMVCDSSRHAAIDGMYYVLSQSEIFGPPTNVDFLKSVVADDTFNRGLTLTSFLTNFQYNPSAIDVIAGGAYTLVQDWPGRPRVGKGFGHSGPMDPLSFRIANALAGNLRGLEGLQGLEITLSGPDLRFLGPAQVSLCGAPIHATLDGEPIEMWTTVPIRAGQRLTIGKTQGRGCRAYLGVRGGFPSVASWLGSKATTPITSVGGYQGRPLAAGDLLFLQPKGKWIPPKIPVFPSRLMPQFPTEWELRCMSGPYEEGFLADDFIDEFYAATFEVSHNSNRSGIRLIGPKPRFSRPDGGEGGAHPSNVIEYGYAIGSLNWTGDSACLFPVDAPDLGGFISSTTVVETDWWKMGQIKAGDKVRFRRVPPNVAARMRAMSSYAFTCFLSNTEATEIQFAQGSELSLFNLSTPSSAEPPQPSVVYKQPSTDTTPLITIRQAGDAYLIVDYGDGRFDLNYRCRAVLLSHALHVAMGSDDLQRAPTERSALISSMPCANSLTVHYEPIEMIRDTLIRLILDLDRSIGDISTSRFSARRFHLPITFGSAEEKASIQRYMDLTRPYASYLPDPLAFVAENNGLKGPGELKRLLTDSTSPLMIQAVGFFVALPIALPIDPRRRLSSPKMNPSRVHTPQGQVGWGGGCLALYNIESPGGYMNTGLSVPTADLLGWKRGFNNERMWLFDDLDQITFYEVDEEEYGSIMEEFNAGMYDYQSEEVVFDLGEHNRLLEETREEVQEMKKKKQMLAQERLSRVEAEMLERWNTEKAERGMRVDQVEELLKEPNIIPVEAPVNANVWKFTFAEGDTLDVSAPTEAGTDGQGPRVAVLEAMKMEIAVHADLSVGGVEGAEKSVDHGNGEESAANLAPEASVMRVEKLLVEPGDSVKAGQALMLLRRV